MFVEPHFSAQSQPHAGWIEAICGSMFSGKTEELIRRLTRARLAHRRVVVCKPALDVRYHPQRVVSHRHAALEAVTVTRAADLPQHAAVADVIGIDEGQFFDADLPDVCSQLADAGKRLIVAGLDMDFSGQPFGSMAALLARAEFVTKLHAICVVCGSVASYSFRLANTNQTVLLGEQQTYQARCRRCFLAGMEERATHVPQLPPARSSST